MNATATTWGANVMDPWHFDGPEEQALIDKVTGLANRDTYARRRVAAMGFALGYVQVEALPGPCKTVLIYGGFTCVCGTEEIFRLRVYCGHNSEEVLMEDTDVWARLERSGSFSAMHLHLDGYSEEQIAEILERGERFDKENCK